MTPKTAGQNDKSAQNPVSDRGDEPTVELALKPTGVAGTEADHQPFLQRLTELLGLNRATRQTLATSGGHIQLALTLARPQANQLLKLAGMGVLDGYEVVSVACRNANLPQIVLPQARLRGIDLSASNLSRGVLSEADLSQAQLRATNFTGAYMRWANLHRADLSQATLVRANLGSVNLQEANLTGADLRGISLHEADLRGATLRATNLRGADLTGSNLCGADLTEATLTGASLLGTEYDEQTRWPADFPPPTGSRLVDLAAEKA